LQDFITRLTKAGSVYEDLQGTPGAITLRPDGIRQIYFREPDGYWIEMNDAGKQFKILQWNGIVPLDQDEPRTPPDIRRPRVGESHPAFARAELRALDRFCAERLLTRSQVVRRSFKTHLLDRAIGAEECYSPRRRSPIPLITSFIRNIGTCLEDKLLNLRDLQPAGARTCNPSPFAEKFRCIFVTNS
jgi:hypothetical protein